MATLGGILLCDLMRFGEKEESCDLMYQLKFEVCIYQIQTYGVQNSLIFRKMLASFCKL